MEIGAFMAISKINSLLLAIIFQEETRPSQRSGGGGLLTLSQDAERVVVFSVAMSVIPARAANLMPLEYYVDTYKIGSGLSNLIRRTR